MNLIKNLKKTNLLNYGYMIEKYKTLRPYF